MSTVDRAEDTNSDRRISQRVGAFGRQEFVLLEDKLLYRFRGLGNQNEFAVSLREIDPDPLRIRQLPWGWIISTVILFLATIGCIIGEMNVSYRNAGVYFMLGIFTAIGVFVGIFQSIKHSVNVFVFRTSHGNMVLHADRPDEQSCQAFVRLAQESVTRAGSIEKQLTKSLLSTLLSEGFLDKWQYEKAVQRFEAADD